MLRATVVVLARSRWPAACCSPDRITLPITSNRIVVPITGGTGAYAGVHGGQVISVNYAPNSDNSDLTVRLGSATR